MGHAQLFPDMYNMMEKSMRLLKFNFVQHPPFIENYKAHLKKKLCWCLEGVWRVSLLCVLRVSEWCLEGDWQVSGMCLECVWNVSKECLKY